MKKSFLPIICLLSLCLFFSCGKPEAVFRQEVSFGTVCSITLYEKGGQKVLDKCFARLQELDDIFNINEENSDISKINKNAGIQPVKVSEEAIYVLKAAKEFAKITDGNFDPTIGPLVKLWNISGGNPKVPENQNIKIAKQYVDYEKLILDEEKNTAYIEEKMSLDVGGIAKGFAADEMTKILAENKITYGIINLGGNIFAYGSKDVQKKGEQWNIGIKNPLEPEKGSGFSVYVKNKTIVTSGNYERYFEANGTRYHHIIDVKNGYPSQNGVVSFTIVADSSMIADALSTSCFILGKEKGIQFLESLGIEGFCITKDRKLYATKGLRDNINILDDSFSFAS